MGKRVLAVLLPALASAALAQPPSMVKDVNTTLTGGTYQWPWTTDFVALGGAVYFTVSDGVHGTELWRSDGSEAGTALVKDICPGACASAPRGLLAVGTTLYFGAGDGAHGTELWKSDGTEAGTVLVADLVPGLAGATPLGLFELGGAFYFSAETAAAGRELWKSDGSEAGTVLVTDIQPGPGGSSPAPMARLGSLMLFAAEDAQGRELWRTDGTAAGTWRVKDIQPGAGSSLPTDPQWYPGYQTFAVADGRLLFNANDGTSGAELWTSDGTAAGTVLVEDIFTGVESSFPFSVVELGGKVLFRADGDVGGAALWVSGGTAADTFLLKDLPFPSELTAVGGWVYFKAAGELWRTDGTEANTTLVKDIIPGPNGFFSIYGLTALGAGVAFFADDGTHGAEPWWSDGTEAGTVPLGDLNAGPGSSSTPLLGDLRRAIGPGTAPLVPHPLHPLRPPALLRGHGRGHRLRALLGSQGIRGRRARLLHPHPLPPRGHAPGPRAAGGRLRGDDLRSGRPLRHSRNGAGPGGQRDRGRPFQLRLPAPLPRRHELQRLQHALLHAREGPGQQHHGPPGQRRLRGRRLP